MQFKYRFKILFFTFLHTIFEFIAFNVMWVMKFLFSVLLFPIALFSKRHWKAWFGDGFHTQENFLEKPLINYDYLESESSYDKEEDGNN